MNTVEKLKYVMNILGVEDINTVFYSVTLRNDELVLQGNRYDEKAIELSKEIGIDLSFDVDKNWLSGRANGIIMFLTA